MGISNFLTPPAGPAQMAGGMPPAIMTGGAPDPAADYLIDYNARFTTAAPARFRDRLVEQVMGVLIGAGKPNALLVGPAGVGKTRIVEDIARRIATGDPLVPAPLAGRTVYELPLSNLVAGSGVVGDLEEKTKAVIAFAADPANRAILFIDEIHQLADGNRLYGRIAQILKPALARGDLLVIGATTTQEARSLDDDPAFRRRFSRLVVDELSDDQTREVLAAARDHLETHYQHQVGVPDAVLDDVVRVADETLGATGHRPDTALTLLDRAMADKAMERRRLIAAATTAGDAGTASMLASAGAVPLTGQGVSDMADRLVRGSAEVRRLDPASASARLHAELVGQDDVLDDLVDRLSRRSLGLFPATAPAAWMFAGASGVGKTAAAGILAQETTGRPPITLSMSEFASDESINRILGSPAGYIGSDSNAELPFDVLESDPARVILLDEFEKACRPVQRLFLQILDEGTLTTARNQTIDFSKTIIIATTNAAGDELSRPRLGFGDRQASRGDAESVAALKQWFDPELLGRFDLVVAFHPIDRAAYRRILALDYAADRRRTDGMGLPDRLDEATLDEMADATFVPGLGARPAGRAVRRWIEDRVLAARSAGAGARS